MTIREEEEDDDDGAHVLAAIRDEALRPYRRWEERRWGVMYGTKPITSAHRQTAKPKPEKSASQLQARFKAIDA